MGLILYLGCKEQEKFVKIRRMRYTEEIKRLKVEKVLF